MSIKSDADVIIKSALYAAMPDTAVKEALKKLQPKGGKLILVATGKAAWQMAKAATDVLGNKITQGLVITKYDHVKGDIPGVKCFEAGHPVPDNNSFKATAAAIDAVTGLSAKDTVLFLVSGGGSALFEKPLVSGAQLQDITKQLLACGADITEINTIRKRLSAVKGGKFAQLCAPAQVFSIILSDIIGDPLDMIASGPAYPDSSTAADAEGILEKYKLTVSPEIAALLKVETPKTLTNVETHVTGSVKQLCKAAMISCKELGYEPHFLTASLNCEARDAGSFLAAIARDNQNVDHSVAYICGGETIVHLTGKGKGGRNQEIALSAAAGIAGLKDTAVFSFGSDGTDGPTDAAGGYADGNTAAALKKLGVKISAVLVENDAYHALKKIDSLIMTGPTGTNVNDLSVLLIKR